MNFISEYIVRRIARNYDKSTEEGFKWVMYAYYKEGKTLEELKDATHWLLEASKLDICRNLGAREAIRILEGIRNDQMALLSEVTRLKPQHDKLITSIKQNKQRIIT
jgi:hypothetical protein